MSDSKNLELYRSRELAESDEYGRYLRHMQFHEQRAALQRTYWENQGKHQTEMVRLADSFEDARQQLEARRQYGPRLRAIEYKKRIADVELELKAKHAMIRELESRNKPKPQNRNQNDIVLQALLARREQLAAEGLDTKELDELIGAMQ